MYVYVKKTPQPKFKLKINRKFLAASFFAFGAFLLLSAVFPIVKFQIQYSLRFNRILNPLSSHFYNRGSNVLGELSTDYTQLSNWFVDDTSEQKPSFMSPDKPTVYYLTIPKLKIKDAEVELGSMDLKKSLIQYPQTALPGQLGNTVVFGVGED